MRSANLPGLVLACALSHGCNAVSSARADDAMARADHAAAAALAIEHVALLSMVPGQEPRPDTTVLVEGQRIAWIGPDRAAAVPRGALRIDGRGRWLLPGWSTRTSTSKTRG